MNKSGMAAIFIALGIIIVSNNCGQPNEKVASENEAVSNTAAYKEGLSIVDRNCIACHAPTAAMENRAAPPLAAVKAHYMESGTTEAEFIEQMSAFLLSPNVKNSKMPKAVEKFGLMPLSGYSNEQLVAAATYIYHADLEKPDWFEAHHQQEKAALLKYSNEENAQYLKKGMNMALATKALLGKNLLEAIQTKGPEQALAFCNEKAIPLTDSMATDLNATIRRASDKARNPANAANEKEQHYIQQAKKDIAQTGNASPMVFESNGKMVGYYPIMADAVCLQCHGKQQTDIAPKTLAAIKRLYPEDKATGYATDELRGIWVIEMEK